MSEMFATMGALLGAAGFPAGLFVLGGAATMGIGLATDRDHRILWAGATSICFGLMCYYGGRFRGSSANGDKAPVVGAWPALGLMIWWLGWTLICGYMMVTYVIERIG